MTVAQYRDRLLQHQIAYKHRVLGNCAPGEFAHRGKIHLLEHILPTDQKWLNIPADCRAQVQNHCAANRVHLHRYFHHLNSSQALAMSLFIPYFGSPKPMPEALLRALGQKGPVREWELEWVPKKQEGTNIDATWVIGDGSRVLCEVKLSEQDFGVAKVDDNYIRKLAQTYRPVLEEKVGGSLLEPKAFFASYQILRNVWHLAQNESNSLVFLFPKANTRLQTLLDRVLPRIGESLRARISTMFLEDLLMQLASDRENSTHGRALASELQAKYIIPSF